MLGEVKISTISPCPQRAQHSKFVKKKKRVNCQWTWSPSTAEKTHGTAAVEMCPLSGVTAFRLTRHSPKQGWSTEVTRDSQQTNMEWELSRNFNNIYGFAQTSAKACSKYSIICQVGWTFWVLHFFVWQFGFVSSTVRDARGLYDKRNRTLPIIWWQRRKDKKKYLGGGSLLGVLTKAAFESQVYFWEKLISIEKQFSLSHWTVFCSFVHVTPLQTNCPGERDLVCACRIGAVAGYERAYVTGKLTSTVGEGNYLKRIYANNFSAVKEEWGERGGWWVVGGESWEYLSFIKSFPLFCFFFFLVLLSPIGLWYQLTYHSYGSLFMYGLFQVHYTGKLNFLDSKIIHKRLSRRTMKKIIGG